MVIDSVIVLNLAIFWTLCGSFTNNILGVLWKRCCNFIHRTFMGAIYENKIFIE